MNISQPTSAVARVRCKSLDAARAVESLERRTLMSAWNTVDADPNGLSINAMAADRTGNVYAAGDLTDAAANVIPVLKQKTVGGATWSTIFNKPGTDYGDFKAVATDAAW